MIFPSFDEFDELYTDVARGRSFSDLDVRSYIRTGSGPECETRAIDAHLVQELGAETHRYVMGASNDARPARLRSVWFDRGAARRAKGGAL